MSFLDLSNLGLDVSASNLASEAIAYIQAQVPDWNPSPTDFEVIVIQANAFLAADVAAQAMLVPSALFRAFGTKLYGIRYEYGAAAQTQVVVTFSDNLGHTIDAGTSVEIGGLGFRTVVDLVVPPGSTTGTVSVVAATSGEVYNGLSTPCQLTSPPPWVDSVAVTAATSGGVDQEGDDHYEARLVPLLRLQAPRPITGSDYATMALSFPPAVGTDEQEIGRAVALEGFDPNATRTFTATTQTGGSANVLASVSSFTNLGPGTKLSGANIPAGTVIDVTSPGSSTITMSAGATGAAVGETVTATGLYNQERTVTVWATDDQGTQWGGGSPATDTLAALAAWLVSKREFNFVVYVLPPTYTPVYASFQIHVYPGFDPTAVAAAAQAAVVSFLSPETAQSLAGTGWYNDVTIRLDKLLGVIQNVPGVDFVWTGTLQIGLSGGSLAAADLVLPGPVALPTSTTTTVPLPTVV